ncbi:MULTISPECIES: AraC-like ligand-binding domain-containing protein [Kitasatospora]|uniref:Helix-turn-helix domain-containing protein n=1 Tax=Kitasatospora cathayae TaxID=3004092 RepID=A0ABY7QGM6_9ACTN|nr:helix-turn-helix domain-containing protein [Kitasatospora sp. HUAS 3-15]WBP91880.1 helix-turn-helix domain-containing protein [Kitasatospora sp. HUAS 3-15]
MAMVFRGEELPAKERFDCWRELLERTRACDATSAHADDFRAELRRTELGEVVLLGTSFPAVRFRRTERMVRRSDAGVYHLSFLQQGTMTLTRGAGRTETLRPGDLHLVDSSTPYDLRTFGGPTAGRAEPRLSGVGIDFPAALLPLPPQRLRDLLGRAFPARTGSAALLSEFLLGLDRQAAALGPAEAARLGTVVVDLVAAWLARELDAETAVPDDARQRALVTAVRAFIRRNLHDPELSPSTIAAAHHISVSQLHRVFAQHSPGETVAAWIRSQRLERARRDLADPAQRATPIHAVAVRWGILRADDFSRAFRAAYGLSPREHRQRALAGAAGK